jgi:hypothetical protein
MSEHAKEIFPSRSLVEEKLAALLNDRISPKAAAAWAWPLVSEEHPRATDFPAWDALKSLAACDGVHPDGTYMYDKISFRAWLEQLRATASKAADK